MAILGNNLGSNIADGMATGKMQVSRFTLATASTLTELHGIFDDFGGASAVRIVIYKHASGTTPDPGATRVAYTNSLPIVGSGSIEVSQSGFSVPLAAGDYWIGARSNVSGCAYRGAHTGLDAHSGWDSGAPDPPPDPFGAPGVSSGAGNQLACWAIVGAAAAATTTAFEATLVTQYPNAGSRLRGLQAGATYRLRQAYLDGLIDPAAHVFAKNNPGQVKALTDTGNLATFDAINAI